MAKQTNASDAGPSAASFNSPELYINRELSWIDFNLRVLDEAKDPTTPLLERCKFLSIVSNNLDEFFMVRVAGVDSQKRANVDSRGPDNLSPREQIGLISQRVHEMVKDQYECWNQVVKPALATNGIHIVDGDKLSAAQKKWLTGYFTKEIFPVLTPMAIDPSHPFPRVANLTLHIIIVLMDPKQKGKAHSHYYAIIPMPDMLSRFVELPEEDDEQRRFIMLGDAIRLNLAKLFPGLEIESSSVFRVTRNFDLKLDEEEAEDLLEAIELELRHRQRGRAVRLEIQRDCPPQAVNMLTQMIKVESESIYRIDGTVDLSALMTIWQLKGYDALKDTPYHPVMPPRLQNLETPEGIFNAIRMGDILLNHPYESFNPVIQLVKSAAADPAVLAIKQTLYRTTSRGGIIDALKQAAENGKQVTVLVELKARFDEDNNITWARELEAAGVHVVYGLLGLKTHCKCLLIVRREEDGIRRYLHLATGNYNPTTARIYQDFGLLTCNADMADDITTLFNILTGFSDFPEWKKVAVAPNSLLGKIIDLIHRERDLARAGKPGRIIAKINSIVDETAIRALYEASCAGVKIDLICRGICCLRPGIPDVSENIRVHSVVGRYLEHSRVFYFGNDGHPEVWLSSADWMPRNFYRRIELMFPIESPELKTRIIERTLGFNLEDNVKRRELQPSGAWTRVPPGKKPFNVQETLMKVLTENSPFSELTIGRAAKFILLREDRDDFGRIIKKKN